MMYPKRQNGMRTDSNRALHNPASVGLLIVTAGLILGTCQVSHSAERTKKSLIKRVSFAGDEPALNADDPDSPKIDPNKPKPAPAAEESATPTPNPPPTSVYDDTLRSRPAVPAGLANGVISPASKMTVRLNPSPKRSLDQGETSKPMKQIQTELQEEKNDGRGRSGLDTPIDGRVADPGVYGCDPYGQYIYVHHEPLLFEDIDAERYGDTIRPYLQPLKSWGKFSLNVLALPVKIPVNYGAANLQGRVYSVDYMGNLRPGVMEGVPPR